MTRIISYEILRVVILNLVYTSMFSDGSILYADEFNPLVGKPFKLVCDPGSTITSTVTIKFPDGVTAGYCAPPSPPVAVDCTGVVGYDPALNETENIVTISTNSLASDVNGNWTCTYNSEIVSYILAVPIREITDESFTLFLPSFIDNITSETASISLSATYGCINLPVYFKWFVVDSASKKIDISGTSNVAENSSVCTSGFSGYTETKEVNEDVYSSSYVTNLDGSYRIGVEVHYTDEVTTLHSIKYFDTYFVFSSGGTSTPTGNKGIVFVMLFVCLLANYSMVDAVCFCTRSNANKYASETSRSQSLINNGTVTPHETGKSQKKSTFDKRQQPDGDEGPQSTPKDPDARHLTTGRPLPRRPDIASPQTGPFDSVYSPRPIVLAPIENPNIPPSIDTLDEQKAER